MQADNDDDHNASVAFAKELQAEMEAEMAQNAKNARKASRNASRKAKPSAARNVSRKASHNNNNNIAEIERQFAKLEMGAKPSSKKNQIAALQEQLRQLELEQAVRRKPRVVSKNVDECKGMLKEELITLLISMGVDNVSPKMLKKDLCALYKSLTE